MRRGLVDKTVARSKLVAEGLAVGTEAVATARAVAVKVVAKVEMAAASATVAVQGARGGVEPCMSDRTPQSRNQMQSPRGIPGC